MVTVWEISQGPMDRSKYLISDTEYLVIAALKRARRANVPVTGLQVSFLVSVSVRVENVERFL